MMLTNFIGSSFTDVIMTSHLSHLQRPWGWETLSLSCRWSVGGWERLHGLPNVPVPRVEPGLVPLFFPHQALVSVLQAHERAVLEGPHMTWNQAWPSRPWRFQPARSCRTQFQQAGRPKLARTSKEAWLSSVTRAVTPTERGPLLALVSQKHQGGKSGPGFGMKLGPGFPSRRKASLRWLATRQSINEEPRGRGVAPFPRLYAFHIPVSKLTTSQPRLAHFP